MDCVGVVAKFGGLKPRMPIGLTRPNRTEPEIGFVELVRDGTAHSWETIRNLVPTRRTRIAGLLEDISVPFSDSDFLRQLPDLEIELRKRIVSAWCEQYVVPSLRSLSLETVLHNISSWVAPYYVCRLLDGFDFNYDCTDAPTGSLMGAATMSVKTDVDFSIVEFAIGTTDVVLHYQSELFRQRIVPSYCGFVEDSIADQLIVNPCSHLTDELKEMLFESIRQVRELIKNSSQDFLPFFNAVQANLERLYSHHRNGSFDPDEFGEP
jgi:hypothetical protein